MTSTDFYPRPPRGGRPIALPYTFPFVVFLSTPSARRATITLRYFVFSFRISIHALREEGDGDYKNSVTVVSDFYPRPPRGGRQDTEGRKHRTNVFLSTPSARRATRALTLMPSTLVDFYPRPPRGGRPLVLPTKFIDFLFLSTPSARRATRRGEHAQVSHGISIHALREEGDSKNRDKISIFKQIIQHSARI